MKEEVLVFYGVARKTFIGEDVNRNLDEARASHMETWEASLPGEGAVGPWMAGSMTSKEACMAEAQ